MGGNSDATSIYTCVKAVRAEPMDRLSACREGLLRDSECQKANEAGYRVIYKDGYVSWSPKDVFEDAYAETGFGFTDEALKTLGRLSNELRQNNGKISPEFIEAESKEADVSYAKIDSNIRICVLTMPTGHKFVGKAMVLDKLNDNEEIGNEVALADAKEQLWYHFGTLALTIS